MIPKIDENKNETFKTELTKLKKENLLLRNLLGLSENQEITKKMYDITITKKDNSQKKINLFRNLFKGREDVYAVRWENQNGKSG